MKKKFIIDCIMITILYPIIVVFSIALIGLALFSILINTLVLKDKTLNHIFKQSIFLDIKCIFNPYSMYAEYQKEVRNKTLTTL